MVMKTDPFAFSPSTFTTAALPEMPESVRAFAEKGLEQVRSGYQQLRAAAKSSNGAMEASCQSAARGVSDFSTKLFEITRTNVEGAFDFATALLGSKSVADAVTLASGHAQKQFQVLASQSQDLMALGKKVASETVEPIKANATRAFTPAT